MKDSTRKIIRMHGFRLDRAIHHYLYFTRYDQYVTYFLKFGRWAVANFREFPLTRWAFRMVFNRYHAKVLTAGDATRILSLRHSLRLGPEAAERVIPFPYANRIILEEPEDIAVMDCPCRLSRANPCQPVNVCMAVGRTTAQFWLEHGAKYHVRRVSQAEALRLIREERERGHLTTAWFKVATGGRTGVICSCCSCCCGGLEAMRLAGQVPGMGRITNLIPSGYQIARDPSRCESCGTCLVVCIFGALTRDESGQPVYDAAACFGCGLCVEKCPHQARSLVGEFREFLPLDLDLLVKPRNSATS